MQAVSSVNVEIDLSSHWHWMRKNQTTFGNLLNTIVKSQANKFTPEKISIHVSWHPKQPSSCSIDCTECMQLIFSIQFLVFQFDSQHGIFDSAFLQFWTENLQLRRQVAASSFII